MSAAKSNIMSRPHSKGIAWGPFKLVIPGVHTRASLPEFLQGLVMLAATGLAIAPLVMSGFGLTFEEAVALSMIQGIVLSSTWLIFGIPVAPGWITPALPMVISTVMAASSEPSERFQVMTAMALTFAAITAIASMTRSTSWLMQRMPSWLCNGVLLGAGLAAIIKIFDLSGASNVWNSAPYAAAVTLPLAILLCFHARLLQKFISKTIAIQIARFGILLALAIGGIVGQLAGELSFTLKNEWFVVPVWSLWQKISPFVIGWPTLEHFISALPVALLTYIILFSDIITLREISKPIHEQLTEREQDLDRLQGAISIRNIAMSIVSPFFSTQGALWTGVQAWLIERQKDGRNNLRLIDRVSSYYLFGIPIAYLISPIMLFLKPLMAITLALTLALTAYACIRQAIKEKGDLMNFSLSLVTGLAVVMLSPLWSLIALALLYTVVRAMRLSPV